MAGLLGDLSTEALLALHADLAKYNENHDERGRFAAADAVGMAPSVKWGFEPDFASESRAFTGVAPTVPTTGEPDGFATRTRDYDGKYTSTDIAAYDHAGRLAGTFSVAHGGAQDGYFKITVRPDAQRQGIGMRLLAEAERQGVDLVNIAAKNHYTSSGRSLVMAYLTRTATKSAKRAVRVNSGGPARDRILDPIVARVRSELIALAAEHGNRGLDKYSDDEPRNERGRWTAGGGGDSIAALSPARRARVAATMDRLRAAFPGHGDVRIQMAATDPEGRANVSAYADQSTQTINLIASQWKGPSVGGRKGEEWTAAPGPEGVVAHEFGHLVAGWIQSPPPGTPVNFKAWNLVDRLSSRGWSDIASSYGAMGDPGENWAEWFSAAYTPGGPKYDAPQAQEIRSTLAAAGITKFNPNHDERGRFASADGGGGLGSLSPATYVSNHVNGYIQNGGADYGRFVGLAERAIGPADPLVSGHSTRFSTEQRGQLKDGVARTVGAVLDQRLTAEQAARVPSRWSDRQRGYTPGMHMIATLNDQWATTSGDHDPQSLMAQRAAAEQFGLKDAANPDAVYHLSDNPEHGPDPFFTEGHFDDAYATKADGLRAALQAEYDTTQAYLKANGIDSLTVYRGVNGVDPDNHEVIQTNPLTSWTADAGVAERFALDNPTTTDFVYAAKVPASRIFSLPMTGMGCLTESEVVLLGGSDTVNVYKADGTPVLEHPVTKAERVVNIDADLANADWPKRTPDRMSDLVGVAKYSPDQARDSHGRFAYGDSALNPPDGLTHDEYRAVEGWLGSYDTVNAIQEHPESPQAKALASALEKSPPVKGVVYRGINMAGPGMPMTDPKVAAAYFRDHVGKVMRFNQPQSTSTDPKEAFRYAEPVMFAISQDGAARSIAWRTVGEYPDLREAVLAPGRYRVDGVTVEPPGKYATPGSTGDWASSIPVVTVSLTDVTKGDRTWLAQPTAAAATSKAERPRHRMQGTPTDYAWDDAASIIDGEPSGGAQ